MLPRIMKKLNGLKKKCKPYGIKISKKEFEVPEPQTVDVEKVAREKARKIKEYVDKPFFVSDTGYEIESLNNFPGALLKPVLNTIGPEKLCILVEKGEKRDSIHKSVAAYVDEEGEIHTFCCNDTGKIADNPRGTKRDSWGDLMKIHVPSGFDKTLAEMSDEEFERYEEKMKEEEQYVKMAKYIMGIF